MNNRFTQVTKIDGSNVVLLRQGDEVNTGFRYRYRYQNSPDLAPLPVSLSEVWKVVESFSDMVIIPSEAPDYVMEIEVEVENVWRSDVVMLRELGLPECEFNLFFKEGNKFKIAPEEQEASGVKQLPTYRAVVVAHTANGLAQYGIDFSYEEVASIATKGKNDTLTFKQGVVTLKGKATLPNLGNILSYKGVGESTFEATSPLGVYVVNVEDSKGDFVAPLEDARCRAAATSELAPVLAVTGESLNNDEIKQMQQVLDTQDTTTVAPV